MDSAACNLFETWTSRPTQARMSNCNPDLPDGCGCAEEVLKLNVAQILTIDNCCSGKSMRQLVTLERTTSRMYTIVASYVLYVRAVCCRVVLCWRLS